MRRCAGGTGVLARDILRHASRQGAFFAALRYVIGERSPALQAAQRRQVDMKRRKKDIKTDLRSF